MNKLYYLHNFLFSDSIIDTQQESTYVFIHIHKAWWKEHYGLRKNIYSWLVGTSKIMIQINDLVHQHNSTTTREWQPFSILCLDHQIHHKNSIKNRETFNLISTYWHDFLCSNNTQRIRFITHYLNQSYKHSFVHSPWSPLTFVNKRLQICSWFKKYTKENECMPLRILQEVKKINHWEELGFENLLWIVLQGFC